MRLRTNADMKAFAAIICMLFAITFVAPAASDGAQTARSLVDKGNELFAAGSFDEALKAYEEAGELMPESGEVLFNKGNAYFRKGDYEKAREAFESAALRTRDLSLEAWSQFNLGNTAFAEAGELLKEDLQKGLERYGLSIRYYRNALRIDPGLDQAAENIEIARLRIKDLLDQIKNREAQEKERRKQQEELKKKLEEVIKEQESEIADNDSLKEEMAQALHGSFGEQLDKLASDQGSTRDKTREVARKMEARAGQWQSKNVEKEPGSAGDPSRQPLDSADSKPESVEGEDATQQSPAKHVANALGAQDSALSELDKSEFEDAREHQEEALNELKQALTSLTKPKDEAGGARKEKDSGDQEEQEKSEKGQGEQADQQSARQQQEDQGRQEAQEKQGKPESREDEPHGREAEPSKARQAQAQERQDSADQPPDDSSAAKKAEERPAVAAMREKPEDILKEEKENRLRFQRSHKGGYRPVDRDW